MDNPICSQTHANSMWIQGKKTQEIFPKAESFSENMHIKIFTWWPHSNELNLEAIAMASIYTKGKNTSPINLYKACLNKNERNF